MTVVNPKSISGINSITTGSGSDNLLTIHTSDASSTERVRINSSGDVIVGSGITVSPDGNIFATGVTTSTTFVGALTGNVTGNVTGTASANAVLTGSTNNTVTTVTGANAIQGESALTFDGNTLTISAPSNDTPFVVDTASTNGAHLRFQKDGSNQHFVGAGGGFSLGDREDLSLRAYDNILFASGNSSTERARVDSSGRLLIGSTITPTSNKCTLQVAYNSNSSSGNAIEITQQTNGADKAGAALGLAIGNGGEGTNAADLTIATASGGSLGTRMTVRSDGDIDVENGDIFFSTSGKGIVLGATSNTAANTLDDYEEGTFTPTCQSGGFGNWSTNVGRYTKIGRLVNVSWEESFNGAGDSSLLKIGGLPFTADDWTPGSMYAQNYNSEGTDEITAAVRANEAVISVITWGGEATGNQLGGYSAWNITYTTSSQTVCTSLNYSN